MSFLKFMSVFSIIIAVFNSILADDCVFPTAKDVPIDQFLGLTWYPISANSPTTSGSCQTMTIISAVDKTHGIINTTGYAYNGKYVSESYPWSDYSDGVLTYSVGYPYYFIFRYFESGNGYKTFGAYSSVNTNPQNFCSSQKTFIIASTNPGVDPTEISQIEDQLKREDSYLTNVTFYKVPQSNCP